jgi:putative transposase
MAALLARVKAQGIGLGCLYLDRGFAAIDVYDYLVQARIPAVLACPMRGKQAGPKALCRGRKSYTTQHTFRSPKQGERTQTVAVVRAYTQTGQRGQAKKHQAEGVRDFVYS